jgi:hypothetical protein
VNALLSTYVDQIEGATAYIRPPEHFITDMIPAPCIEALDSSPDISIFAHVEDRQALLVVSLIALRVNPHSSGITSCVFHDAQPILPNELGLMCKTFIRHVADNRGGIRWQHKYNQILRDIVD